MPITVHVVGDNAVLWGVLGTLGGAVVGWLGSWLTQRSKIDADREHAEREALRAVLDEAGAGLARANAVLYRTANLWAESFPPEHPSKLEAEREQRDAVMFTRGVTARLKLRLPQSDLVLGRYTEAVDALNKVSLFLADNAAPGNFAQHEQGLAALQTELDTAILNFQHPAQQRYGPKLKGVPTADVPRIE